MIIGLYGNSRSGKDTAAWYISENYGFEWLSFAIALRELLYEINPIIAINETLAVITYRNAIKHIGLDQTKGDYPESIELMIRLGQGARDILGENIWVNPVMKQIHGQNVVISDVRQQNEYDAIISRGGEVWNIVRPDTTKRGMDGLLDHCCFPVILHNDTSIDDFHDQVKREMDVIQNSWT